MAKSCVPGWRAGVLLLLVAGLGVLPAAGASAHAELESSDPANGAVLASAPAQVTLTFGEDLIDQGNAITAKDLDSSERVALPEAVVDADTASVDWPAAADSGRFEVSFRVVSADGHPITGSFSFSVGQASASASPSAASSAPAEESGRAGLLTWILGFGFVVLVGVGAGTWFWRRTRRS